MQSVEPLNALQTDRCYRCDYDLRGIGEQQPCPECGLLAWRSRQPNDDIRFTHPKELRKLSVGVWLLLIALALAIVPPLVILSINATKAGSNRMARSIDRLPMLIVKYLGPGPAADFTIAVGDLFVLDIASVVFILGIFVITRRDAANLKRAEDFPRLRIVLRSASFIPLVAVLIENFLNYAARGTGPLTNLDWRTLERLYRYDTYFVSLGSSLLPILLMLRLRSLAHRTRSAHLTEHCTIVGIGTSLSLIYFAIVIYLMNSSDRFGIAPIWTSRGLPSLLIQLLSGVAIAIFGLWSVYLQARFALRFLAVARERSKSWLQNDEAS